MGESYEQLDLKNPGAPEKQDLRKYFERCNNLISYHETMSEIYANIANINNGRTFDMNYDLLERQKDINQRTDQRWVNTLVRENNARLKRLWDFRACLSGALREKDPVYHMLQVN